MGRGQVLLQLVLGAALCLQLAGAQVTQVGDVAALVAFKKSLEDPVMLRDWEGDPCVGKKWSGVSCKEIWDASGAKSYAVQTLWLPGRHLFGTLPEEIGSMTELRWVSLSNNGLSGKLPTNLGSSGNLLYLDLSDNLFEGEFHFDPKSTSAYSLHLASNKLTGPIATNLTSLPNLKELVLSNNRFNNTIPEGLAWLPSLEKLELDNNELTGGVPSNLANLPSLKSLQLQNNDLEGNVPATLASKPNTAFYGNPRLCNGSAATTCDAFPAPPPPPPANSSDAASCLDAGTTRICYCSNEEQGSQTCQTDGVFSACLCGTSYTMAPAKKSTKLPWFAIVFIVVGSLLGVLVCFLLAYGWRQRTSRKQGTGWEKPLGSKRSTAVMDAPAAADASEDPETDMYAAPPVKSIRALAPPDRPAVRKPTAMSIGRSWGRSVTSSSAREYYAEYDNSEPFSPAAASEIPSWPGTPALSQDLVQMSFHQIRTATHNFDEENILGNDGLARVYRAILPDGTMAVVKELEFMANSQLSPQAFADEVDVFRQLEHRNLVRCIGFCSEDDSRMLVFEYVPNGSLDWHLHGLDKDFVLDWNTRMHILLGAARGLEFLHDQNSPLVHQEMRSPNVLLDTNYDAKLSDYALGQITGHTAISQNSATANMAVAAGTAAPELAWAPEFSPETDVYAFGVLLLEVVTGRRPLDPKRPPNEQALVRWARPRLTERNRVEGLVDWKLGGVYSSPALYQVALLAWQCIQVDPAARPNMAQVVEVLQKVQHLPMDVAGGEHEEEQRLHDFLSVNVADSSSGEGAASSQWAEAPVAVQVEEESGVRPPGQWPTAPSRQSQFGRSVSPPHPEGMSGVRQ